METENGDHLRITALHDVAPESEAVFGGKACGLARLLAAGAKVPAGFAVAATMLVPRQWSNDTREAFRRHTAALLDRGPLAVRSSAVGEDSAQRSFAGMFETVLGVTDVEAAFDAAACCIASADSARVRAYAGEEPIPGVGLVVQQQVEPRAAGVCFTLDPSGRDAAVVIEAVAGSGDRLVSGHAQPARWRVYRSGLGTWDTREDGAPEAAVITPSEATRIAKEATRHAAALNRPLDLEWAVDRSGDLWWLQARAITAARSPQCFEVERAFERVDDGPVTVWANWNVRETLPDPLLPLTWSLWRDVIHALITDVIFGTPRSSPLFPHLLCLDLVHGRIYFNMNGVLGWPVVGALLRPRVLKLIDPQAAAVCGELMAAGVLRPRRLPGPRARLFLSTLRANLVSASRFAVALRPRRALQDFQDFAARTLQRQREQPLSSLTDQGLLGEMKFGGAAEFAPLHGLHCEVLAIVVYHQALRAFRDYPQASRLLAAGIPANPTTQISLAIDELTIAARPLAAIFLDPLAGSELLARLEAEPDGRVWLEQLHGFLARFGHRGPKEFDIGAARWREDPSMIIELVRAGLASPAVERVSQRLDRLAKERAAAVATAVATAPWWRRPMLRWLARLVELYMPLREAPKHYVMLSFQRMREAALELGGRFAERGHLGARADVFFLDLAEIETLTAGNSGGRDWRARVAERRARFERFRAERPPDYLRSDGVPVITESAPAVNDDGGGLHGTGVSAGTASGPVRILREPDPRAMSDGDVIVMEFADPGWTPLFPRAAAVVMEVGGLMCHAAVVARELGIPAVFGISGATRRLRNGQHVAVDADRGTVTPQ
ncbi:MAG: hypothetical protein HY699_02645 [Deltaproteobacteria bacterium]|nr:hypothetical protein [Deltaproteobacteria bacterium]